METAKFRAPNPIQRLRDESDILDLLFQINTTPSFDTRPHLIRFFTRLPLSSNLPSNRLVFNFFSFLVFLSHLWKKFHFSFPTQPRFSGSKNSRKLQSPNCLVLFSFLSTDDIETWRPFPLFAISTRSVLLISLSVS